MRKVVTLLIVIISLIVSLQCINFYIPIISHLLLILIIIWPSKNSKLFSRSVAVATVMFVVISLSYFDLGDIPYLNRFITNIKLISLPVLTIIAVMLSTVIFIGILSKQYSIRFEKFNIGGFSILFENPDNTFKRQVKNYLLTKRSLFKIDLNHDNFEEVFDSYYQTYQFIRNAQQSIDTISKDDEPRKELLEISSNILRKLNIFLTKYQNNYRRWFEGEKKQDDGDFYKRRINEIQNKFYDFDNMIRDFKAINDFFVSEVAEEFDIDSEQIEKWEEDNFNENI